MDISGKQLEELGFVLNNNQYHYKSDNTILEYWVDGDWFFWAHDCAVQIHPKTIEDIKTLIKIICS